jgi:hypothetical protein
VVPVNSQVLITPSGFVGADSLGAGKNTLHFGSFDSSSDPVLRSLRFASKITLSIDTVIFEDGQILGPDEFRQADYIKERKAAATALVARVRDVMKNGQDVSAFLTGLFGPPRLIPENWFLFWTEQHARRLHHSRGSLQESLASLEELPILPVFFRK